MARPPKVPEEEILDVARACLVERGPAVSTAAIAERVGLSEAALFKRFGTKRELMVRACCPPAVPPFLARLEAGPDLDRPVRAQLEELALEMLDFFASLFPRLLVLKSAGVDPVELLGRFDAPPPVVGHLRLSQWFARAAERGLLAPHDSDALAYFVLGSLQARIMLPGLLPGRLPEIDRRAYVAQLASAVIDGLRPREDG